MTADTKKHDDQGLETFFQALREESGEVSPDLLARVLADAYEEQDARGPECADSRVVRAVPRRGAVRYLLDAIGGWPAVAGLATATVAGIWIGYNPPAALDSFTLSLMDNSYGVSLGASLANYDDLPVDG